MKDFALFQIQIYMSQILGDVFGPILPSNERLSTTRLLERDLKGVEAELFSLGVKLMDNSNICVSQIS